MLIWHDSNKKIDAWNESISKEEAQQYISSNCVLIEEEINFPEVQENQMVEMYLNDDSTIRYEIIQILPQPSTDQELIQAQLLLDQAQILANQRTQDEVLATILLEQVRGEI